MISLDAINRALKVANGSEETYLTTNSISYVEEEKEREPENVETMSIFKSFEKSIRREVLQLKLDLLPRQDSFDELTRQFHDCATMDYTEYTSNLSSSSSSSSPSSSSSSSSTAPSSSSPTRHIPRQLCKYFTANTFLILPKDKHGHIKTEDLLKFIQKSMHAEEVGLNLLRHCITDDNDIYNDGDAIVERAPSAGWGVHGVSGDTGFISEAELERYIFELIPKIDSCKEFKFSFYPFYAYAASRKFFFFQDQHRTRRIAIKKLAHCNVMEEFLKVQKKASPPPLSSLSLDGNNDNNSLTDNWFHGSHVERIYNTYLELDVDENGTLSEEELYHFGGLNPEDSLRLTRTAIRRLLEETVTYSPVELDFKGFLDLVLALGNKVSSQSLTYFWKIIDVDKSGRLSEQNIIYFYKEIFSSLKEHGCDAPEIQNVTMEIFDILSCQDPRGPTLQEVIKSGQGHIVMSMLLDVTGFWQYDNRESLIAQQQTN